MNAGNLGVVGRIGWYIPKYVIEEDPFLEYWRTLTRQDAIEKFHYSRNTCGNGEEFCEGALFLGGHEAWVQVR